MTFERRLWIALTSLFLILLCVAVKAWVGIGVLSEARESARKTFQTIDAATQLLSALKDAETGQRGFLLTADDTYLEPLRRPREVIPDLQARLLADVGVSSEHRQSLIRSSVLVRQLLDLYASRVDAIHTMRRAGAPYTAPNGEDSALQGRNGQSKAIMDELRGLLGDLEEAHRRRLATQSTEVSIAIKALKLAVVLGSILGLLWVVGAATILARSLRRHVHSAAQQMAASTLHLRTTSHEQELLAAEAAHAVERSSATLAQLSAFSGQISHNGDEALSAASSARELSSSGAATLRAVVAAMHDVRQERDRLDAELREMGRASLEAQRLVQTTADLSSMTTILGVNATIEAQAPEQNRAGQTGRDQRRFAMVAAEIRSLAERSTASSRDVRELLENLHSAAQRSLATGERVSASVDGTLRSANALSHQFDGIVAQCARVETSAELIERSTAEHAVAVRDVSDSLATAARLAASTRSEAAKSAEVSSLLAALAQGLQQLVSKAKGRPSILHWTRRGPTGTHAHQTTGPVGALSKPTSGSQIN